MVAHRLGSVRQAPRLSPRILAAIQAVDARLSPLGAAWAVGGSAARALAGFDVRPRDLDLEVEAVDGERVATALGIALARESGGGRASMRGEITLAGVEVDLSAGLSIQGVRAAPLAEITRPFALGRRQIHAITPEEQLCRAILSGEGEERARRIQLEAPIDWSLPMDYLERRAASVSTR